MRAPQATFACTVWAREGRSGLERRTQGNRGRCLQNAIPELDLATGDRLEPSPALQPHQFEASRPGAGGHVDVLVWRRPLETRARRRRPIFSEDTGLAPEDVASD